MRILTKAIAATTIAALLTATAGEALAATRMGGFGGGPHMGGGWNGGWRGGGGWNGGWRGGGGWYGGGWGPGYGYGWGPAALGLGLVAGAAVASSCYRSQPIYDPYGRYIGNQVVNVCY